MSSDTHHRRQVLHSPTALDGSANHVAALTEDTVVRTAKGDMEIKTLQVGDKIIDDEGVPREVVWTGPPRWEQVMKVVYYKFGSQYAATCDVHGYTISKRGSKEVNDLREGLKELKIFSDKSEGVPDAILRGSPTGKLKCLAGLIDSDGTFRRQDNTYVFRQWTVGHEKIVHDAKLLAEAVGISVSGPHYLLENESGSPGYSIILGAGCESLQPFLKIPYKRIEFSKKRLGTDTRRFEIVDGDVTVVRPFKVNGGLLQLADRLIVHDSHRQ